MDSRNYRRGVSDNSSNVIAMNFDAAYFFERGVRFLQRNDLNKALKAFKRTVEYEPNNAINYCNVAGVLSEMGDFQGSNELLQHVLDNIDPNMAECQFYLANNYANMGDYGTAEEHVLRYLDADPNGEYVEDAEEMLTVLMDEFGGGEAFERWQEEKRKEDIAVAAKDGRYFLENGQFEAAVEWLEKVVQENRENYAACNNLCLAYYYTGQHDKALSMADEVLYRQPDNIHALCNRAVLLKHFGWTDILEAAVEPLRKVFPLHYELAMKVGTTLGIVGYHEDALAKFKRLIRLMPDPEPILLHAAAAAAANSRHFATAERYWNMLLRMVPQSQSVREEESNSNRLIAEYFLKQLKVVNQSGEDWHVSYQLDLPVEAQLAEVKNKLQQTDVDEWRKDPLLRASLYWGLRHGNQETRRRVIRALAVVRDDDAERALKLFLERKDVSGQVRLHALVALKQMGACGVVHVMEQGELKAVQLEDIADDIIFEMNANWRAVWDRAQAWFEEQGLRKLMVDAKRVWIAYLYELFLHAHRIGKPEIWAAGLIYVILRYFDIPVVQRELAEFFHVSASSIRKSSVRLEQVMLQTGL